MAQIIEEEKIERKKAEEKLQESKKKMAPKLCKRQVKLTKKPASQ